MQHSKESLTGFVSLHVLGPVTGSVGACTVKITAPRQRALLAYLLINANETVSTSKLIDGIWGGSPPLHPESTLQIVVSRLRRALGAIAPRLVRDSSGYRIELDAMELDLLRAQSHFVDAQRAMRDGDAAHAAASLESALGCWTGETLADVANFPFRDAASRQLHEFRLELVELRNVAYLRCGRHLEVLEDIETWIRDEPWRERLRAHQMIALYRTGRQIEALAVYEALRRLLCSDFGVEPGDDIQRLHGRILRRDPTLLESRCTSDHSSPVDLTLEEELLVERLRQIALDPTNVVIVEGGPGVDKTWLVVEVPRRVRHGHGEDDVDAENGLRRLRFDDALARISTWRPQDDTRPDRTAAVSSH
ncbi:MAG TPA: BTAD domain-containing putative transcriptional regulator [Acidimicrobiia bacterium]